MIAAIDIGSNSIHLTLARVGEAHIEIVGSLKDSARLARHLDGDGCLSREGVERAVTTLRRFHDEAAAHGALVRATATAALRAARNVDDVLARIRRDAGVEVQLISGHEEARLTYLGVLHGLPELRDVPALFADVGGGSTEVAVGRQGRLLASASVAVGSAVVAHRLLGPDPVGRKQVERARRALRRRLAACVQEVKAAGFTRAVATGGTIQRVARVAIGLEGGSVPIDVHGLSLTRDVLGRVVHRLAHAPTQTERQRIPGMEADRADSLLGGALILQVLADELALDQWIVSMTALRTGLLVDTWSRRPPA